MVKPNAYVIDKPGWSLLLWWTWVIYDLRHRAKLHRQRGGEFYDYYYMFVSLVNLGTSANHADAHIGRLCSGSKMEDGNA